MDLSKMNEKLYFYYNRSRKLLQYIFCKILVKYKIYLCKLMQIIAQLFERKDCIFVDMVGVIA